MQLLNDIATMIEDIWIKRVHLQRLIQPFIDSRPTNRQLQYLFFELNKNCLTSYTITIEVYALKYFLWIMEYSVISDSVSIHVSNKIPMKVVYSLGEENYIKFWLAPKFDDYD